MKRSCLWLVLMGLTLWTGNSLGCQSEDFPMSDQASLASIVATAPEKSGALRGQTSRLVVLEGGRG